ncbi:MAG: hypothetical protein JWR53_1653 [Glaciihabitans sp.]|nr:hypothetical protein [Glaciihabitans sp.]
MSDDKDDTTDGSDWLAGQFDPTAPLPRIPASPQVQPPVPPPAATTPPVVTPPPLVQPPAYTPPPLVPPPAAPRAAAPPPSTAPPAAGGFTWGLRPGSPAADDAGAASLLPVVPPSPAPPTARLPWEPADPPAVGSAPTQAMSWQDVADTQAPVTPTPIAAVPVYNPPPAPFDPSGTVDPNLPNIPFGLPPDAVQRPHDPTSAIDSLFGASEFKEYEEQGVLQSITTAPPDGFVSAPAAPHSPRAPISKTQKILLIIAGALVAALILVALYAAGVRAGAAQAQAPTPGSTGVGPTTAPTTAAGSLGPGTYAWNRLLGGECLQPFKTAWQGTYTVVDCATPHAGQLILKGTLPDAAGSAYPGSDALVAEITPLCTDPKVFNYAVAGKASDVQLNTSYPPNEADWQGGNRTFYCFIARSAGGALPGDIAVHGSSN